MLKKAENNSLGLGMLCGIFVSFLYAAIAIFFLWKSQVNGPALKLNEVGDYLAGAFSPLAFLWLVVGYLMQNKELKTQIEEFKSSVIVAESNLKLDIKTRLREEIISHNKAQPIFNFMHLNSVTHQTQLFEIFSIKSKASEVKIYSTDNNGEQKSLDPILTYSQIGSNKLKLPLPHEIHSISSYDNTKIQKIILQNFLLTYYDDNEIKQAINLQLIASHQIGQSWIFDISAESNRRDVNEELKALEHTKDAY